MAGVLLAVQGGNAAAANVKACRDFHAQGVEARSVASPTLADVARVTSQVAADAAEATQGSQLRRDLDAWASDPVGAHSRILADCALLPPSGSTSVSTMPSVRRQLRRQRKPLSMRRPNGRRQCGSLPAPARLQPGP